MLQESSCAQGRSNELQHQLREVLASWSARGNSDDDNDVALTSPDAGPGLAAAFSSAAAALPTAKHAEAAGFDAAAAALA